MKLLILIYLTASILGAGTVKVIDNTINSLVAQGPAEHWFIQPAVREWYIQPSVSDVSMQYGTSDQRTITPSKLLSDSAILVEGR